MAENEADRLAKIVWDYSVLHQKPEVSDVILALGSMDLRVAQRAAELWRQGFAPIIMASGGVGRLSGKNWAEPEAQKFAESMHAHGVLEDKILVEDKSTNTAENFDFSMRLLRSKGLEPKRIIVVTKTYMERRAWATGKKLFPELEIIMASPELSFDEYPNKDISKYDMINIMVGDLQRIKLYPQKGFTIPQVIPAKVETAMNRLINLDYEKQLIKNT